jgi:hypothetical protein
VHADGATAPQIVEANRQYVAALVKKQTWQKAIRTIKPLLVVNFPTFRAFTDLFGNALILVRISHMFAPVSSDPSMANANESRANAAGERS